MNPPNEFRDLRRLVGPAAWLFVFLAAHTPEGWIGDAPTYVAGGNIISDAELVERMQITLGTLASWRRRLRKAHLLDWLLRLGVGRVYIIGPLNQALADEQAAIQKVAAKTVQTALRSAEGNAGFVN
jgi:hypothetical protein